MCKMFFQGGVKWFVGNTLMFPIMNMLYAMLILFIPWTKIIWTVLLFFFLVNFFVNWASGERMPQGLMNTYKSSTKYVLMSALGIESVGEKMIISIYYQIEKVLIRINCIYVWSYCIVVRNLAKDNIRNEDYVTFVLCKLDARRAHNCGD